MDLHQIKHHLARHENQGQTTVKIMRARPRYPKAQALIPQQA